MKKLLFSCIILCLIVYSFFFPEITINAAKNGIQIWFHQILPALLPFTILSSVLVKSDFLKSFKGNSNLIAVILTMTCGFIFGFPVGSKLSADFYKQNLISKKQATFLAITTNNFSPMYVCGFAIPLLFASDAYKTSIYILLYLIPLIIATLYLLLDVQKQKTDSISIPDKTAVSFHLNMQVIDASIISGFESLIKICGYIVLFSILTEIAITSISNLISKPPLLITFLLSNLEITNGIQLLSACDISEKLRYVIAIQALSFGGISGIAQTASIFSNTELSMHKYIIGKASLSLLLTLLSVIYVFIIHSL